MLSDLQAALRIAELSDGFYWIIDPRKPGELGVIHRINGNTWAIAEGAPVQDNEWYDDVRFIRIAEPSSPPPPPAN